jgi:replicative DNA helicase
METIRSAPAAALPEVRVPPQNLEAEQSVLGAMLMSRDAIETVVQTVRAEDFYRESHRRLFETVSGLYDRGEPVDMITLANELKRTGDLERLGGVSGLAALVDRVPTAANVEYYATIVREKSVSRQLIHAATRVVSDAYSDSRPLAETLDDAERLILEATELKRNQDFLSIKELVGRSFEYVSDLAQHQRHITGVPTGFYDLDELTAGLQPSNLVVIGARPSVGKTSLALNIAQHVSMVANAGKEKMPVGFFSLEMTAAELALRLLCSVARIDMKKARSGYLSQSDTSRLSQASGHLYDTPLFIDDTSSMTVLELKAKARRLMRQHHIGLLIVDYLQLIQAGVSTEGRVQEVAYVSRQLKALAKDLSIPVVVLSQLSRPQKGQEDRKPVLSDLRESGAIEQDADVVLFIHREPSQEDREKSEYEFMLAKQRNGPTGVVPVVFISEYTMFESKAGRK